MTTVAASAAPADMVGNSVVLVGSFEPTRVQPSVLFENGLLNEGDILGLSYEALVKDVTVVKMPWITLSVEREKLSAASTLEYPAGEPIRDFVLGLLEIMPVRRYTALGINRDAHIPIPSMERYQALMDRLGGQQRPELASLLESAFPDEDDILLNVRVNSVGFEAQREDGTRGAVKLRFEPSARVSPGLYIQVNDHFEADGTTIDAEPEQLLKQLTEGWGASMRRADSVVSLLRSIADGVV
jgi:hypothetical protein